MAISKTFVAAKKRVVSAERSSNSRARSPRIRFFKSQVGASSVEFALIASLLFAIIFATIEFAIWSVYQTVVTGAARDSATQYSVTQSADQAMKKAFLSSAELTPGLTVENVQFFINGSATPLALSFSGVVVSPDQSCLPGEQIKVKISYEHNLVTGTLVETFLGFESLGIQAESVTVCG